MAPLDEVRHGGVRPAGVVADHGIRVEKARRAVNEDERDAGGALALQVAVVALGRGDDDPVDAPPGQGLDQLALAVRARIGGAGERQHSTVACHLLDATVQRREEGVSHILEDQADRRRQAIRPSQRARGVVVAVAEQADRLLHARREVGSHRSSVDDPRDGCEADAGDCRGPASSWGGAHRAAPWFSTPMSGDPTAFKKTISRLDCNEFMPVRCQSLKTLSGVEGRQASTTRRRAQMREGRMRFGRPTAQVAALAAVAALGIGVVACGSDDSGGGGGGGAPTRRGDHRRADNQD